MQVSVYLSESDYETLSGNKPTDFRTVAMYLADILRKKAESFRVSKHADETLTVSNTHKEAS